MTIFPTVLATDTKVSLHFKKSILETKNSVRQPNAIFPHNPKISDIVFFSADYLSLGCIQDGVQDGCH